MGAREAATGLEIRVGTLAFPVDTIEVVDLTAVNFKTYELQIDLWATANVFRAGHRIRLDVSSSNFPRFDRNTNTGQTIASDGPEDVVEAVNRVFHDRQRPSHVLLPIVDRS